jgi:hypothetical protein
MRAHILGFVLLAGLRTEPAAFAQGDTAGPRAIAFDSVVAVQDMFFEDRDWPTQLTVDLSSTARVAPNVFANLRPKIWRIQGEWRWLLDQASLRYEFDRGARVRIEAGRFPSPIGLGMVENRPNMGAGVLWSHRLYYQDLPSLGPGMQPQALVSALYPVGVSVMATKSIWDVRAALMDRAPVDPWTVPVRVGSVKNRALGVGISPRQGLRLGAATAWGPSQSAVADRTDYRMVNVEGEWAFGYTKISGEWNRSRFDTPTGDHTAHGLTVQARQTLTPRVFAHSRATLGRTPQVSNRGVETPRRYHAVDSTVGYLLNPDVTLRIGHTLVKSWTRTTTDHQLAMSIAVAHRWW